MVSLEANDMDLTEAVNTLAVQVQVLLSGQEHLVGKVTVYLKDVNVLDALRIILDPFGLAFTVTTDDKDPSQHLIKIMTSDEFESQNGYSFNQNIATKVLFLKNLQITDLKEKLFKMKSESGKIFFDESHSMIAMMDSSKKIVSMENYVKERDVPLKTEIFKLHFVQGTDVINSIQTMLTQDFGRAKFDDRSNSIVITDTENKIQEIAKFIKDLDQQNKQVVVSAKVIQVTLNEEHSNGIDWEAILSDYQSVPFEGLDNNTNNLKKILSFGSVNEEDLKVLLDALDTVGIPNVISDSKMTVDFNEDFDIVIDSEDLTLMSEPKKHNKTDEKNRKARFDIYTFMPKDDALTAKIKPSLVVNGLASASDRDLKIDLKDGSTVVVGSLFKNVTIESTRKIPFLGDLPLVGFVFRNQGQRELRTETVLFLTLKTINKEPLSEEVKKNSNEK